MAQTTGAARTQDDDGEENPLLRMQTGLFEHARKRALDSGATKPDAGDEEALAAHASSMARDLYQPRYEPSADASDAGREAECQRTLKEREEADAAARISEADVKDKEAALSSLPPAGERPAADPMLVGAAFAALLLSVAPTIHDLIAATVEDAALAWIFAALAGSGVALFVTLAILLSSRAAEAPGGRVRPGVVAGLVVGLGLLLVRLAGCASLTEALMPFGLTLVEIGVVLFLDWHAAGLAPAQSEWRSRRDALDQALRDRDSGRHLLSERLARVEDLTAKVERHVRYVDRRRICSGKVEEIEASAVKAVRDGYHAGLAENRGRVRGTRRKDGAR